MNETRLQTLQSIQQALDSDWHNWQKPSYIRSRIQVLPGEENNDSRLPPAPAVRRRAHRQTAPVQRHAILTCSKSSTPAAPPSSSSATTRASPRACAAGWRCPTAASLPTPPAPPTPPRRPPQTGRRPQATAPGAPGRCGRPPTSPRSSYDHRLSCSQTAAAGAAATAIYASTKHWAIVIPATEPPTPPARHPPARSSTARQPSSGPPADPPAQHHRQGRVADSGTHPCRQVTRVARGRAATASCAGSRRVTWQLAAQNGLACPG
jgi:hypothetical protein